MLRIGICDDERDLRFFLRCRLERILEPRGVDCEFYEFSSGEGLLGWYEKQAGALELLFLDIEMDGLNGMETAKKLRAADSALQMVFVTGHPDYVFDGYAVGALGYLMKPPESAALEDILQRAMTVLHTKSDEVYICRNSEGSYRLPKTSILYFFSEGRRVVCVTKTRSYSFYAKLDQVAGDVGRGFVRIHQRYLVNSAAVTNISGGELRLGETALPVSRAYQKEAMLALTSALLD